MKKLEPFLIAAGFLQFALLIASSLVPTTLEWKKHLAPMPKLLRQLFWVYGAFIVLMIIGLGSLTLINAGAMAVGEPAARSLSAFAAIFWFVRLIVQFFVFDTRPYLTNRFLKIGERLLTLAFIYLTIIFAWAALFPSR